MGSSATVIGEDHHYQDEDGDHGDGDDDGEDEEDDDHDGVGDAEEEDDDVNYRYRGGGLGSYCSIPNARGPKYPLLHCMTKFFRYLYLYGTGIPVSKYRRTRKRY